MTLHAVDEFTLLQRPRKLPGRDISTTNNPNDTIKQEKPRGVATAKLRKRDAENAGGSTPSKTSRKRGRCSDKAPSNGDESHCEAKPTSRRRGKGRSMGNGSSHPDGAAGSAASQGAFGIVSSSNERNDPASLATARRNATMATARDARPAASPQLLLTEAQRAAAFHDPSVPLLVVAAAGSGKTSVICHRIIHLISQFTRRAGQSLRQRLHQLAGAMAAQQLDKAASGAGLAAAAAPGEPAAAPAMQTVSAAAIADVRVSTFHSFCLQTLRQFAHLAGLPKDFTVFPPKMQAEALMELLQEWAERKAAEAGEREEHDGNSRVGMPTGKKLHFIIRRFLQEFGRIEVENAEAQVLEGSQKPHQSAATLAPVPAAAAAAAAAAAPAAGGHTAATDHGHVHRRRRRISFGGDGGGGEGDEEGGLFAWLWEQYRRRLVLNKAIDFSQFAPKAVKLLHAHPEILASSYMRSRAGTGSSRVPAPTTSKSHLRVSHVLVDEFQDTDSCQMELLLLLCRPLPAAPTLTLVADDDQQIYSFRGAMGLPNLRRFLRTYPQARTVCLDQNFRSCGSVVEASRHVIAHNQWRHAKWMVTAAPVGPLVSLCECRTERCEAAAVVGKICHLVGTCGVPANQIAILYRVQAVGKVAICLRTLQCAPHRISLLPAARMTRLHLLGISRCPALSSIAAAGHIGAHNDPDISAARTGGAPNGSYGRAPNGGAPPPPPSDPAWPPVLGPDDLKVLDGIGKMAAAVSELQGLLGIPPPGWTTTSSSPAPASFAGASFAPASRRRGSTAGIMGLGGSPARFPALLVGEGGNGEEEQGDVASCEALGRNGGALDAAMFAGVKALLLEAAAFDRERRQARQAQQASVAAAPRIVAPEAPGAVGMASGRVPASSSSSSGNRANQGSGFPPPACTTALREGRQEGGSPGQSLSPGGNSESRQKSKRPSYADLLRQREGVVGVVGQAKGLEWQAVIVVRANEGVLPLVDFSRATQPPATTTTNYPPTPQSTQTPQLPLLNVANGASPGPAAAAQGGLFQSGASVAGRAVAGREGSGRELGPRPLAPLPAMPPDYDSHLEEELLCIVRLNMMSAHQPIEANNHVRSSHIDSGRGSQASALSVAMEEYVAETSLLVSSIFASRILLNETELVL
ncbi:hypothetical protein CLOM_g14042 [Closterium sp. NIES-68]|nr:hypothetical protein CLOM_g14042 [Closterium sp. NIES-68]